MSEAGINFGLFTSHSCRSASTSKATEANIDLQAILKSANWSGDLTFKNHYLWEIQQEYPPIEDNFALKLLLEQWDSLKSNPLRFISFKSSVIFWPGVIWNGIQKYHEDRLTWSGFFFPWR